MKNSKVSIKELFVWTLFWDPFRRRFLKYVCLKLLCAKIYFQKYEVYDEIVLRQRRQNLVNIIELNRRLERLPRRRLERPPLVEDKSAQPLPCGSYSNLQTHCVHPFGLLDLSRSKKDRRIVTSDRKSVSSAPTI